MGFAGRSSPQRRRPDRGRKPCVPQAFLLAAALALPPLPAAATGTIFCSIEDRNLSFELAGDTSVEYGTIIAVHTGSLRLKPGRYAKSGTDFAVTKDSIFLQWSFDRDLRFAIHVDDPDNERTIILAIIAERDDRLEVDNYRGRYVLQFVGKNRTDVVNGRIKSCQGD